MNSRSLQEEINQYQEEIFSLEQEIEDKSALLQSQEMKLKEIKEDNIKLNLTQRDSSIKIVKKQEDQTMSAEGLQESIINCIEKEKQTIDNKLTLEQQIKDKHKSLLLQDSEIEKKHSDKLKLEENSKTEKNLLDQNQKKIAELELFIKTLSVKITEQENKGEKIKLERKNSENLIKNKAEELENTISVLNNYQSEYRQLCDIKFEEEFDNKEIIGKLNQLQEYRFQLLERFGEMKNYSLQEIKKNLKDPAPISFNQNEDISINELQIKLRTLKNNFLKLSHNTKIYSQRELELKIQVNSERPQISIRKNTAYLATGFIIGMIMLFISKSITTYKII